MDKFKARAGKLRESQTSAEAKLWQALRNRRLEACGFHIVRVSNTDVYENLDGVLEMIEGTLRLDFRFD